jgi:gliding motility-associated-like protein
MRKSYTKTIFIFIFLFISLTLKAQLNADFSITNGAGCVPLTSTFTNLSTGTSANTVYSWDFGNSNTSQLKDPSAIYLTEGTYTVTLIAKDGNQTSTKTKQVNVYKKHEADFTFSTAKGCLPLTVTFTSASKPGDGVVTSYFWDFGDGTTQQTSSPSVNHIYQTEGKASVNLTVTNQYGCYSTVVKNEIIQVLPKLEADFTVDQRILCRITDEVKFTNNSNGPGTLSYLWNFGDGTTSTEKDPKHIFAQKGIYSIALTVTSSEGCVVTNTESNFVNVASFQSDFSLSSSEICAGYALEIKMLSTPEPTQTNWEMGDGTINNYSNNFSHSYFNKGEYEIKLVNSFGSCKDSVTKIVKVKSSPVVNGFIDSLIDKCGAPARMQFVDTSSGVVAREWSFMYDFYNPVVDATTKDPVYTYPADITYYVRLKVTNAEGCSTTVFKYVTVTRPYVYIEYLSSSINGLTSCDPFTVKFNARTSEPISVYKWIFPGGTTSSEPTPSFTFTQPSPNPVVLEYTTVSGCKGSAIYNNVNLLPELKADFVSTKGTDICGDTIIHIANTSKGERLKGQWFLDGLATNGLYPNADNNDLYLRFTESGKHTIMYVASNGFCNDTMIKVDYLTILPPFPATGYGQIDCNSNRDVITFFDSSSGVASWHWDFGDGKSTSYTNYQKTIDHKYDQPGKYTAIVSLTNGACTLRDTLSVIIHEKKTPTLTLTDTNNCAGATLNFTISGLQSISYPNNGYWVDSIIYEDGTLFNGNVTPRQFRGLPLNGYLTGLDSNQQKLRFIISNSMNGCADTSNYIDFKVRGAIADFVVEADNQCFQQPVVFNDKSFVIGNRIIVSRTWDFGDGNVQTLINGGRVTHNYQNPGSYYVTLTVTDNEGCISSFSYNGYVRVKGPKAAFSASATDVALNTTVYFNNRTNTYDAYNSIYTWDFGDGSPASTEFYPSHTFAVAGTYTVTLTATDSVTGCTSQATEVIVVRNFNSAFSFTTSFVGSAKCPPVIARFTNTSSGAVRVKWDFGDGSTADNINYPSHVYTNPGTYIVTLYVFGDNGLTGTYIDSVKVKNLTAAITFDPKETCSSQPVSFQAAAAGVTNYLWDFGDGKLFSSGDSTTVHSYRGPGVYKPSLLITNSDGCTVAAAATEKVTIDSMSAKISGIPLQACNQVKINFKADVYSVGAAQSQNFLTYKWNFGTGNTGDTSNIANPVFEYKTPGTYTVTLLVTARSGCVKEVKETVLVKESSKVTIAGPEKLCAGETATFTSSATITNGVQWNWDFKNGQMATIQNPATQTYNTAGSYPVTLIVNNQGCFDTAVHVLTVNALPVIQLSPAQPKVCLGNSIQLSATGGTAYQWTPAVGLSDPQIASPLASPAVTTGYRVLVTNQYGCKKTDSITVTVVQPFSLNAKTDYTICENESVQLVAAGAASYKWINNTQGLSSTTSGTVSAKPTATTTYTVVGYDAENCFTDTININVVVNQRPVVTAGPDVQSLPGNAVQLNASGSADVTSYMWRPPDFLSCVQCASPVSTTNKTITYIVDVTNDKNCMASDSVTIQVLCNGTQIFIPNSFTPNGDGKNDFFSVLGNGASFIKLFVVYDRWGNKVFERTNLAVDDPKARWDGNYKGYPAPIGSFTYTIQLTCDATGESFVRNGTISIIR